MKALSLRSRFLLVVVLGVVVPLGLVGLWLNTSARRSGEELVRSRLESSLLELAERGLPAAGEALDLVSPQYVQDLISWTAIGARTTESQTHRKMASGFTSAVGFKNGTGGDIEVAIDAMFSAAHRNHFLSVDPSGRVAVVRTKGNPHTHIVLRGGGATSGAAAPGSTPGPRPAGGGPMSVAT